MQVDRRALHTALKELSRQTTRSPLQDVLLSGKNGTLTLCTTDLTTRLSCELPAEGDDLTTCLPAKLLSTLTKPEGRGDAGTVDFELTGKDTIAVTMDGLSTRLAAGDPTLFPADVTTDQAWSLLSMGAARSLHEALAWVLPAASKDPTRKHLQSVYVNKDVVVATDGHRLHLAPSPLTPDTPLLLPSSSAAILMRILKHRDDVQAIVARNTTDEQDHLRVLCGKWNLTTRLLDEQFPPYQHVVPDRETQSTQVIFDTAVLAKALAQVRKLSEGSVKVTVNGVVTLAPWGMTLGEAEVIVPTITNTHDVNEPDLEVGLDVAYLAESLPRSGGTVEIGLRGQLDPVRLDLPEQRTAVIMPLRL